MIVTDPLMTRPTSRSLGLALHLRRQRIYDVAPMPTGRLWTERVYGDRASVMRSQVATSALVWELFAWTMSA